jgi:hypothetical protein
MESLELSVVCHGGGYCMVGRLVGRSVRGKTKEINKKDGRMGKERKGDADVKKRAS